MTAVVAACTAAAASFPCRCAAAAVVAVALLLLLYTKQVRHKSCVVVFCKRQNCLEILVALKSSYIILTVVV